MARLQGAVNLLLVLSSVSLICQFSLFTLYVNYEVYSIRSLPKSRMRNLEIFLRHAHPKLPPLGHDLRSPRVSSYYAVTQTISEKEARNSFHGLATGTPSMQRMAFGLLRKRLRELQHIDRLRPPLTRSAATTGCLKRQSSDTSG